MHDPADTQPHDAFHDTFGHVVPLRLLAGIFAGLVVLTFITVGVTYVDFGSNINLFVAIGIAVVKASLVGLYFMHLRWDSPFNSLVLVMSLAFVALIICFTLMDSFSYSQNLKERPGPAVVNPG